MRIGESTTIRFGDKTRVKAIERSLKKASSDNLSQWIREAIDLRIYLEQRGTPIEEVMSGRFLESIETGSNPISLEGYPLDEAATTEQLKAILRMHGMLKVIMHEILSNPNLSMSDRDPGQVFEAIKIKTEEFTGNLLREDENERT